MARAAMSVLPRSGFLLAPRRLDDGLELLFGGVEQFPSLAGALGGQQGVPARDQPFGRVELGSADLGHVSLVEDRQLQVALIGQGADCRRPRCADPRQFRGFEVLPDARVGDQAAVADHHYPVQGEAVLELLDVRAQRAGVRGVAREDFDRHRAAVPVAEQSEGDLRLASLAVSGVAVPGERALRSFEVDRGQVAEDECAFPEAPFGELPFDARLSLDQPVHGPVELVGRGFFDIEFLAEGRGDRLGCESAGGGELGPWIEDAGGDHGGGEAALSRRSSVKQGFEAEFSCGAEGGCDVSVRSGADDLEGGVEGGERDSASEEGSQALDELVRPLGEVGERALPDLSVLAVGLSQQDCGRGVPVGHAFDVHGFAL